MMGGNASDALGGADAVDDAAGEDTSDRRRKRDVLRDGVRWRLEVRR